MCDGARDETQWTLRTRSSNQPVRTLSGHTFIFSEEVDAQDFLQSRPDAASLQVVAVPNPDCI